MNKILGIFAIVSVLLTGCKEDETTELQPTSEKVSAEYKDGRLVFSSLASYEEVMKEIIGMSEEEMDDWEESLGFSSYRTLRRSEQDDEVFPVMISTLLNENKEYQIGDSLIWFDSDNNNVYVIPDSNEELLLKVQSSEDRSVFGSYRKDFITTNGQANVEGEEFSKTSTFGTRGGQSSPEFQMYNGQHTFTFRYDHRTIFSGGFYYLQLSSFLRYYHKRKKAWYLAGELVPYRSIGNVRVNSPQNITVTSTFAESRFTNGSLILTYGYSSSAIYGPGTNDFISCLVASEISDEMGDGLTFSQFIEFI